MTARMELLRARVLRLLEETDAGASENWRDSDPGYWVGVAEGAYSAERERDEALEVLREVESIQRGDALSTWRACPVCHHMAFHGEQPHYNGCRLAACLRARSGGSDGGEG